MKCIQLGTCIEEECVNCPVVLSATFAVFAGVRVITSG